jgi:probable rRNA maturation factor
MIQFPTIEDLISDDVSEKGVHFFSEDVAFEIHDAEQLATWIEKCVLTEGKAFHSITYIFCSDNYLHKINVEYLEHDDYTDVITFPYQDDPVEGDVFISIERVKENAVTQLVRFEHELHRIMIHGALHLCGYTDKTPELRAGMTEKENFYLNKI